MACTAACSWVAACVHPQGARSAAPAPRSRGMYVCMYVCMSACLSSCLSVCLSVCMYICMYIYVCIGRVTQLLVRACLTNGAQDSYGAWHRAPPARGTHGRKVAHLLRPARNESACWRRVTRGSSGQSDTALCARRWRLFAFWGFLARRRREHGVCRRWHGVCRRWHRKVMGVV